jgi:ElaB/YqjD/DUF883 family membrane-anchored ribosome-binding protein
MTDMTGAYDQARDGGEVDPEGERIVVEIEQTRSDMAGTIDEIGHRLQPQTIANEVTEKVRDATVGKVERFMGDAGQTVQKTSNGMIDTFRQNPVPTALAAIGIGWLALRMRDQSSSSNGNGHRYSSGYRSDGLGYGRRYTTPYSGYAGEYSGSDSGDSQDAMDRARQGAQDVADQAAQRAQQFGSEAQRAAQDAFDGTQQKIQSAQWQVDRTLNENPLALGALAVGLGAAVALAIPETQKEREVLGEQRDKLVEKVSTVASDAMDQAQTKAQEIADKAKDSSNGNGTQFDGQESENESEAVYTAYPDQS